MSNKIDAAVPQIEVEILESTEEGNLDDALKPLWKLVSCMLLSMK
jgi:hypothetical protein